MIITIDYNNNKYTAKDGVSTGCGDTELEALLDLLGRYRQMSLDIFLDTEVCPRCNRSENLYHANITHNLTEMAEVAGIYTCLWHPEDINISRAGQLIELLEKAIEDMKKYPDKYKKYDSPNSWGTYKHFVPWLEDLLSACKQSPDAMVEVNR